MTQVRRSSLKKKFRQSLRLVFGALPTGIRFAFYRAMVDCDPEPDARLELKIAETEQELEDCFRILHDAYVGSGFMKPDLSGMRIRTDIFNVTYFQFNGSWFRMVAGSDFPQIALTILEFTAGNRLGHMSL